VVEQQTEKRPMRRRGKAPEPKSAPKESAAVTQAEPVEPALHNPDAGLVPDSIEQDKGDAAAPAASPRTAGEETAETRADTPLDYMLRVMRDPDVEPARRDEMAKLALPYLHPKPTAIEHTGRDGGPIEISDVSEADIVRRIGFIMARDARDKAGN
jgi:hypothetical protein